MNHALYWLYAAYDNTYAESKGIVTFALKVTWTYSHRYWLLVSPRGCHCVLPCTEQSGPFSTPQFSAESGCWGWTFSLLPQHFAASLGQGLWSGQGRPATTPRSACLDRIHSECRPGSVVRPQMGLSRRGTVWRLEWQPAPLGHSTDLKFAIVQSIKHEWIHDILTHFYFNIQHFDLYMELKDNYLQNVPISLSSS